MRKMKVSNEIVYLAGALVLSLATAMLTAADFGLSVIVSPAYFGAFLSGVIYGFLLDLWRLLIPHFNPDLHMPGTLPMTTRIIYFIIGFFINAFGALLYFRNKYYPQVYEFFVKGISEKYQIELPRFKLRFDLFVLTLVLSFCLFHGLKGVGAGTVIMACLNGPLIGVYGRWFDRHFEVM